MEDLRWRALNGPPLSLTDDVRPSLIRQEESIIFALIERSQYSLNPSCYYSGSKSILAKRLDFIPEDPELSLMDYFLLETERFQAKLGRYSHSEEHAFCEDKLGVHISLSRRPESKVMANRININDKIKHVYINKILPAMCNEGDGKDLGSTCTCDVAVLQALSKRIHYGKFVAEAKFQAETQKFTALIEKNDAQGLMAALTHEEVEAKVIERVKNKASHYGTDGTSKAYKVEPEIIAGLYKDFLIPLNKQVQVEYLLQRLDRPCFAFSEGSMNSMEAGKKYFGTTCSRMPCSSILEVFQAVTTNKVPFGVIPIENPAVGILKETQRLLLESQLKVSASVDLPYNGSKEKAERYFIIGPILPTLMNQVSHFIVFFATSHQPGSLVTALNSIGTLNITRLESIPNKANEYYFYCEVESPSDINITETALKQLEEATSTVKVVGFLFNK